jgi:uncharacterized protein
MRFWDASAIVPLLVEEPASQAVLAEYEQDPEVLVWWGTEVQCVSALAVLEREGKLSPEAMSEALLRLAALVGSWREIQPTPPVRRTAIRLLRLHDLRASDALQLSAAIAAAEHQPETLPLVTLDGRLAQAAERQGFSVVRPQSSAVEEALRAIVVRT